MNAIIKKLSIRQVASLASLTILALALPVGLYVTDLTHDIRQHAQEVPITPPITCNEQCPNSNDFTLLQNCNPPDTDGNPQQSFCNFAGRVETCGGTTYCCPSPGNAWTSDLSSCPPPIATPTPTPTPTPPGVSQVYCQASTSAVLKNGEAPFTIRLSPFSASAGGSDGIVGYQWDFEDDGVWDSDRFEDHAWIDHTYQRPGIYHPKYRVRGHVGYSESCYHPYQITVAPSPSPSASPSPTTTNRFDMNSDGRINITDYTLFISGFINGLAN